jgi:hypothetical protein
MSRFFCERYRMSVREASNSVHGAPHVSLLLRDMGLRHEPQCSSITDNCYGLHYFPFVTKVYIASTAEEIYTFSRSAVTRGGHTSKVQNDAIYSYESLNGCAAVTGL